MHHHTDRIAPTTVCFTTCWTLAGIRNISMGLPRTTNLVTHHTIMFYHRATCCSVNRGYLLHPITARGVLYAILSRQDNHTSHGAVVWTTNKSMGQPTRMDPKPIAHQATTLPLFQLHRKESIWLGWNEKNATIKQIHWGCPILQNKHLG